MALPNPEVAPVIMIVWVITAPFLSFPSPSHPTTCKVVVTPCVCAWGRPEGMLGDPLRVPAGAGDRLRDLLYLSLCSLCPSGKLDCLGQVFKLAVGQLDGGGSNIFLEV